MASKPDPKTGEETLSDWATRAMAAPYPRSCPECKHQSHRGRCQSCLAFGINCATRKP